MKSLFSDSVCKYCGGPIGNMSDICLYCNRSRPISWAVYFISFLIGVILVMLLIMTNP